MKKLSNCNALRADAYAEQTGPPDGESKEWWSRLHKALGTVSTDFAFRENEIDETVLPNLTAEDLKELGVASLGHRHTPGSNGVVGPPAAT